MIQLRVRTEYSFGRTFAPIKRLIARLKAMGVTHAGIVDFGGTWGHYRWTEACRAEGIVPLLGVELIISDEEDSQQTMWFLARNLAGLREMYRFTSDAHKDKIATKRGSLPRLRRALVRMMSDNVIKFAGDILDADFLREVGAVLDLNPASRIVNATKRQAAASHGLVLVETSDNSYAAPDDRRLFELIADRGVKPTQQHIIDIAPTDAMRAIAESCAGLKLEKAPMVRAEGDLLAMCREGAKTRDIAWDETYEKRLLYEIDLIRSKDFESYFIVVADMVRFAKQHMLVGPSRGSAAGSLVCYLSRITEIDPIKADLFFERFIDVTRQDLPDIDLDFPDDKRHLVFEYMTQKYGADKVSHIGTVAVYKPRSALIATCKKLGIPPEATGQVKTVIIERSAADERANNCLLDTLNETEPGKQLVAAYPEVMMATELEGHASHTGVHAAGLLVANVPINDYATVDENGIAQIEKGAAEKLNLLKIDVLGLRTLGILEDSGVPIDWYNLKFNDPATFDIFNRGLLSCIFQFEGNALRAVSRDLKFKSMVEIDAATALARPGPFMGGVTQEYIERASGRKQYHAMHPLVEPFMRSTYGLPVYQEQTMAIVREIGKFDWSQTAAIRKGISKRMGKEYMDKLLDSFIKGAGENGVDHQEALRIWDIINVMGSWQMNKAHTYSYAVISYWTAYLKAHHPLEFAAANLRSAKDEESALKLLRELHREGIIHQYVDPMRSEASWSVKDGKLLAGFDALHGFGEAKAKKFVAARAEGKLTQKMIDEVNEAASPFKDIFPLTTKFRDVYDNPQKHGVLGKVMRLDEFDDTQEGSFVFIGKIIKKNPRDSNEPILIKRRGGKVLKRPTAFLDVTFADDTHTIIARIDRFKYEKMGRPLFEGVPVGAVLMVRANFSNGIRFGWVQKWKRIDEEDKAQ